MGRNYPSENNVGFTLIELLITIAVIGILAIGIINLINPVTQLQKARDAQRKSDLSQIQKALEVYHQDNGRYPGYSADYYIVTTDANDPTKEWGTSWLPYMNILPKDPSSPSKKYVYYMGSADGQTYYLYASLDRENDPQACNNGRACSSMSRNAISDSTCGGTCNYGVSTPNVSP